MLTKISIEPFTRCGQKFFLIGFFLSPKNTYIRNDIPKFVLSHRNIYFSFRHDTDQYALKSDIFFSDRIIEKFHNFDHWTWFQKKQSESDSRAYQCVAFLPFSPRHSKDSNYDFEERKKIRRKSIKKNMAKSSIARLSRWLFAKKNVQFHAKRVFIVDDFRTSRFSPFHHSSSIIFSMPFGYFSLIPHAHKTIFDS